MNHMAKHHVFSHEISDFIHTSRGTYVLCMINFFFFYGFYLQFGLRLKRGKRFFFFFLVKEDICIKTKSVYYKRPLQYPGCKTNPSQAEDGQTIRAKASVHWFASLYMCSIRRFGNFLKRSLQLVSKGSRDKLTIEFFIKWTTARASSSIIRLCMFSVAAICNPSWRAHSSAITLFNFPQILANPLIQLPCSFLNIPPPPQALSRAEPSVFSFVQLVGGFCHEIAYMCFSAYTLPAIAMA